MARRCLQEWADIVSLKMELYRKVWDTKAWQLLIFYLM